MLVSTGAARGGAALTTGRVRESRPRRSESQSRVGVRQSPIAFHGPCGWGWRGGLLGCGANCVRPGRSGSRLVSPRARSPNRPVYPFIGNPEDGSARVVTDVLAENRTIILGTQITPEVASDVVQKLLYLDGMSKTKEIQMFINCPGGNFYYSMAIFDAMNWIKAPIRTVAFGLAGASGALLLSNGAKGRRAAMPNARIMLHQPMAQAGGVLEDVERQAAEVDFQRVRYDELFSQCCEVPIEKMKLLTERENFMSTLAARKFGFIDEIIDEETLHRRQAPPLVTLRNMLDKAPESMARDDFMKDVFNYPGPPGRVLYDGSDVDEYDWGPKRDDSWWRRPRVGVQWGDEPQNVALREKVAKSAAEREEKRLAQRASRLGRDRDELLAEEASKKLEAESKPWVAEPSPGGTLEDWAKLDRGEALINSKVPLPPQGGVGKKRL